MKEKNQSFIHEQGRNQLKGKGKAKVKAERKELERKSE